MKGVQKRLKSCDFSLFFVLLLMQILRVRSRAIASRGIPLYLTTMSWPLNNGNAYKVYSFKMMKFVVAAHESIQQKGI